MDKKKVFYWSLYDFANSIVIVVFFLYFSQWLVIDKGVSDFWYNMIFVAGSALLIFTAPVVGLRSDRRGRQLPYLNTITILTFFCLFGSALVALFWSHLVFLAAVLMLLGNYFYQFSFVFYNAMLHRLASAKQQGLVSGIGQAGNWLGQITGILVTLPLATGAVYLFGEPGRAQTLLLPTILFLLFALPLMYLYKETAQNIEVPKFHYWREVKSAVSEFRLLLRRPGIGYYLLAYFLFNDAILTALNNFPIVLEQVYQVSDKTKSILMLCILITSVIGALASAWLSDRIGLRRSILFILAVWTVWFVAVGFMKNFSIFAPAAVGMGLLFGWTWTVTRAMMSVLLPPDRMNYGMSFYTLAERFSTFLGPLIWGILVSSLSYLGPTRYRITMACMAVFVLLGFFVARKIPSVE